MPQLKNDRLLRAIYKKPLDRTPIWIMRQAGRYLPEYRALRERAGSFMHLCKTPELACEATLQPMKRYALDAAILFSDILTIPDALGLGLQFIEGEGPVFSHAIRKESDVGRLPSLPLEHLNYVYETIRMVQQALSNEVPLIGFCGSPWTLAAYMIEGKASPHFEMAQKMMLENPELLHNLLSILGKSVLSHLQAQIEAGVDIIMLFDTFGGLLSSPQYEDFSLRYIKEIILSLKGHYNYKKIPLILFTKGGGRFLEAISQSGCEVVGVDFEVSLKEVRERIGSSVAIQGNMNPTYLLKHPKEIRQSVFEILEAFGKGSGHIFNLGHGITKDVDPSQVTVLVEAVHEFSAPYHE